MIHCPRCGIILHLDEQSRDVDMTFNVSKWGEAPSDCFRCKGCGLLRPLSWWDVLELDIDTEIKFTEEEIEEVPEELAGYCESPWGD